MSDSGKSSSFEMAPVDGDVSSSRGDSLSSGGLVNASVGGGGSLDVTAMKNEIAQLKASLIRERQRRVNAESQNLSLRRESARAQVAVEEEEEAIANRLMKRLSELKQEKEQIARASESDSEWVTNSLTARLEELRKQKSDVIAAAEAENEFIVNRLNKELEALRIEKNELERRVEHLSRSTTPAGGTTPGSSPARSFSSGGGGGGGFSRNGSLRLQHINSNTNTATSTPATNGGGEMEDRSDRIAPMPNSPYSGGRS